MGTPPSARPSSSSPAGPTRSSSSTCPSSSPDPARSGSPWPRRPSTRSTSWSRAGSSTPGLIHQPEHTGLGWDFAGAPFWSRPRRRPARRHPGRRPGRRLRPRLRHLRRAARAAGDRRGGRAGRARPGRRGHRAAQRADRGPARRPPRRRLTAAALLVTGAAGAVGGYVVPLALGARLAGHRPGPRRGRGVRPWHRRGASAREPSRRLGRGRRRCSAAGAGRGAGPRRRGQFVGVQSGAVPASERGIDRSRPWGPAGRRTHRWATARPYRVRRAAGPGGTPYCPSTTPPTPTAPWPGAGSAAATCSGPDQ